MRIVIWITLMVDAAGSVAGDAVSMMVMRMMRLVIVSVSVSVSEFLSVSVSVSVSVSSVPPISLSLHPTFPRARTHHMSQIPRHVVS